MIDWGDIRRAVESCLSARTADEFLDRLERLDMAVLPLQVRRNAELFGVGMVTKSSLGFDTLDPVRFVVKETPPEV